MPIRDEVMALEDEARDLLDPGEGEEVVSRDEVIEPMDLEDLEEVIRQEMAKAVEFRDRLGDERAEFIKYYNAEPIGGEEQGRSQYVSQDVKDTVLGLLPLVGLPLGLIVPGLVGTYLNFLFFDLGVKDVTLLVPRGLALIGLPEGLQQTPLDGLRCDLVRHLPHLSEYRMVYPASVSLV